MPVLNDGSESSVSTHKEAPQTKTPKHGPKNENRYWQACDSKGKWRKLNRTLRVLRMRSWDREAMVNLLNRLYTINPTHFQNIKTSENAKQGDKLVASNAYRKIQK
jgi:hypothetical protein